jgi:hypothetical protein
MQKMTPGQRARFAVLAVSPSTSDELKKIRDWQVRAAKKTPLISEIMALGDPELSVTCRYGLLIPFKIGGRRYSYQVLYLLDLRGAVKWKSIGSSRKWTEPKGLQDAINRLIPPGDSGDKAK